MMVYRYYPTMIRMWTCCCYMIILPIISEGERIIYNLLLLFREDELTIDDRNFHDKTHRQTYQIVTGWTHTLKETIDSWMCYSHTYRQIDFQFCLASNPLNGLSGWQLQPLLTLDACIQGIVFILAIIIELFEFLIIAVS